jgi:hypothetical protein
MKRTALLCAFAATTVLAGPPEQPKPIQQPAPPITTGTPPAPPAPVEQGGSEQKVVAGRPVLIAPEQANNLIARFKEAYPKMGSPRVVLFVNRELVDESSGLKLQSRTRKTQSNSTEVKSEFKRDASAAAGANTPAIPNASNVTIVGDVSGRNHKVPGNENINTRTEKTTDEDTYKLADRPAPALADKQTVRDLERLFGRPLRMAGVNLADQRIAAQLLTGGSGADQAKKDREALNQVADVAIEILISSRNVTVPEISGDKTYSVPDIQATAIRLKDSRILGQAVSSDIIGKDRYAGNIVRNFDVREIAEATALALMEDMLAGAPEAAGK